MAEAVERAVAVGAAEVEAAEVPARLLRQFVNVRVSAASVCRRTMSR